MSSCVNKFFFYLITLALFTVSLFANIEEKADEIGILTAGYLYDYDEARLQVVLKPYLETDEQIQSLFIYDSVENKLMVSYYKNKNGESIFNKKVPDKLKEMRRFEFNISYNKEKVGRGVLYYRLKNTLNLTKEELEWLKKHPKITVHNEINWMPMNFNKEGIPTGLSIELMNLLAKKIGIKAEYITGEWNDLYNKALNKKLDVMLNIVKTKEREKFLLFTSAYQKNKIGIYALKNDKTINSMKSLNGKKVAIVDGFFQESLVREKYPLIQIIRVKNSAEALKAVCTKEADATIGSFLVINNMINEIMCYELEYKSEFSVNKDIDLRIAVRNDYPLLRSILQKALADVGSNEINKLRKKWIGSVKEENLRIFTKDEIKWIKEHPMIQVGGESDWAPFDFIDENNQYNGLSKDYLDLISSISGLKFNIHTGQTWNELLEALKNKKLDMLPAIYYSKERAGFAKFTNPYLAIADYYITKEDYPKIDHIKSLYGEKVAAIKGYDVTSWLKKNHPDIELIIFDTLLEALRSVESGESIAFLNDNPSATYIMEKNFISNLKMNNLVKNRTPISLHMAVKQGYGPLAEILNKSLKTISREKKKSISNRWMSSIQKGTSNLNFTEEEINWLSSKPVIRFAVDPKWLPIEAINPKSKHYEGMMADYLERIKELTGIKFKLTRTQKWKDSERLIKTNKIDMLAAVSITPQREKSLRFSDTTITLTDGVIMNNNARFISDLSDLKGLKIGVSEGTSLHEMLRKNYPRLIIIPIKGTQNGIMELDKGNIDAYIGNLEVISHIIFTNNLLNLKVVLKLDNKRELHIALHKSYPKEAVSVINKAIKAIGQEELSLIRQRWIGLKINEKIDYTLFIKIALGILVIFLVIVFNNRKLKKMVDKKTADILRQKEELENLSKNLEKLVEERTLELNNERNYISSVINSQENIVISTSGEKIKTANRAFFEFYKLGSLEEFHEKYGECICDTFDRDETNEFIQKTHYKKRWIDYIFNYPSRIHKVKITIDEKTHIFSISVDKFMHNDEYLEVVVFSDITELENIRKNIEMILSNIMLPVLITSKRTRKIIYANEYAEKQYKIPICELIGSSIDTVYTNPGQKDEILSEMKKSGYVENLEERYRTRCGDEFIALLSVKSINYNGEEAYIGMVVDISKQKEMENEIRQIHKHTKDSIEYASLIQHALIPSNDAFKGYYEDYFTIWHPKDIVGGDIYLFIELAEKEESLLMVIDCTGHGVPGAFVTMLVKAIERQMSAEIILNNEEVRPAKILSVFNKNMKHLLKQENDDSISNAGFDGGVLYYNKREKIIRYAGAETSLFYMDKNNDLKMIKGDRHSVGYKKSDINYRFKEYEIRVEKGMKFYLSTDGYIDQNGGKKGYPFGKKRFKSIIENHHEKPFKEQEKIFLEKLKGYQGDEERNDDVTLIGVKI